jgi:glutamate dehydrogenase (NAD(P)+)
VTVSYFEWTQNLQQFYWDESEVQQKLEAVMDRAYSEVADVAGKRGVSMRTAAFMVAIRRVYEAVQLRGI